MLDREAKKLLRSRLFRHLDGIVVAPVAYSLFENKVCSYLLDNGELQLSDLCKTFNANEGYLNVALRVIASQGWINYQVHHGDVLVGVNEKTKIAFDHFKYFKSVIDLLNFSEKFHHRKFAIEPFLKLESLFNEFKNNIGMVSSEDTLTQEIQHQVLAQIEGHLVSPTIVRLGMGGMFHKYFMEASFSPDEYHEYPDSFEKILDFLCHLNWFVKNDGNYKFTDTGLFFAKRSSAYGVTVSYMPMFRKINDLCFGNPSVLWPKNYSGPEIHVDREMNVWGSGGAHSAYFKKIDEIIIDIFNQALEDQPKGILDMGCGNGAFLIHLFDIIEKNTLRGKHLEDHPLFLVGVDYNKAALKVTRANLVQADIWAKVIWGDISDPDQLALDLKNNYDISLSDLLNARTFLDHNRIWSTPQNKHISDSESTGAFASRGTKLSGKEVENNLYEHFNKWKPYIAKFGLIVIELHTINPELTARNIGLTAATAYDATHGFSDQYILELASFQKVLKQLGLKWNEKHFSKYPNSDLATVSIHHLKSE